MLSLATRILGGRRTQPCCGRSSGSSEVSPICRPTRGSHRFHMYRRICSRQGWDTRRPPSGYPLGSHKIIARALSQGKPRSRSYLYFRWSHMVLGCNERRDRSGPGAGRKDFGHDVARETAKLTVVYHRRAGGQSQHSTLLDRDATSHTDCACIRETKFGQTSIGE